MTSSYIHVVNLDTVGGVETLYMAYLKAALAAKEALHHTCVAHKRPHPAIAEQLSHMGYSPFLEQYLFNTRVLQWAKWAVNLRRYMIYDIVSPALWVFWNRIENTPPHGSAIYYEHGASWSSIPSKKQMAFLNGCSAILANSQAAAIMLHKKWNVERPITVIENPLRPDVSCVEKPRAISSSVTLGFIGRFVPIKGLSIVLHTIHELKKHMPINVKIAGSGTQHEEARQLSEKLNIQDCIQWLGNVSDVQAFYDSIDLLIMPSIREPLGLVSIEAAARGVPTIGACVDGLAEAVIHGTTGVLLPPTLPITNQDLTPSLAGMPDCVVDPTTGSLVAPKLIDPAACANEIYQLMHNPQKYTTMSMQAINHAKQRSHFDQYYTKLSALLYQALPEVES